MRLACSARDSRRPIKLTIWLLVLAALQLEFARTQNANGRHEHKSGRFAQARTKLATRLMHKFAYDNTGHLLTSSSGARSTGVQRLNDRAAKEPQAHGAGAQLQRDGLGADTKWRVRQAANERLLMDDFGRKTSPFLHYFDTSPRPIGPESVARLNVATNVEQQAAAASESNLLYTSQRPAAVDVRSNMVFVRDTLSQPATTEGQLPAIKTLSESVKLATISGHKQPPAPDVDYGGSKVEHTNELFDQNVSDENDSSLSEPEEDGDLSPPSKVFIHLNGPGLGDELGAEQEAQDGPSTMSPGELATKRDLDDGDDDAEAAKRANGNQLDELMDAASSTSSPQLIVAETKQSQQQQRRKQGAVKLAQALSNRLGQPASLAGQRQEVRSATSGIRVTLGNGTRPLFVNSRGLITAVKRPQQQQQNQIQQNATTTGRPYNPAQLFASSLGSHTLEPIDYTRATSRPPSTLSHLNRRPQVDFSHPNKQKYGQASRPSYQTATLGASRPLVSNSTTLLNQRPAMTTTTTTKWPGYLEFNSTTSHMDEPRRNLSSSLAVTNHHELVARPSIPISSLDEGQQSTTSAHVSEAPGALLFNSSTSAATSTTIAANFHHNPPYKQTPTQTTSATSAPPERNVTTPMPPMRANTRRPTGNSTQGQHPKRPSSLHSVAPYEPNAVLSEPANKLQATIHNLEPLSTSSSQTSSQTSNQNASVPPGKIRIKLHNLLRNKLLVRPTSQQPPAVPLLSSAVANNVASLIAQKLSALVRPAPPPTVSNFLTPPSAQMTPLNSFLFGMRLPPAAQNATSGLNRLRIRVNPFAAPGVQPASYSPINKRTASVGSLLVSGLLYGLTVLPALMALTGINPLSPQADTSTSESQLSAQNSQDSSSNSNIRKTRSSKRPAATSSSSPSPSSFSNLLSGSSGSSPGSPADQAANFAYLIPLSGLSMGGAASDVEPGGKQTHQTLEFHQPTNNGGSGALALGHEAQSSALRSLYAPPPTVLEPFAPDLNSLLEDQNELDWPPNLVARPSTRPSGSQDQTSFDHFQASRFQASERLPVREMDNSGWTTSDHDQLAGQRRHRDLTRANWLEEAQRPQRQRQQQQPYRFSQSDDHNSPVRLAPQELASAKEAVAAAAAANSFDDRAAGPGPDFPKQARLHPMQALASVTMGQSGDISLGHGRQSAPPPQRAEAQQFHLQSQQLDASARPLALQKGAASVSTLIQVSPPISPITSAADQAPQTIGLGNDGGVMSNNAMTTTNRHHSAAWSVGTSRANQGDVWATTVAHRLPGDGNRPAGNVQHSVSFQPMKFLSHQQAQSNRPAEFGDDFAILGPYKAPQLGQVVGSSIEFDAGAAGLRQRRNLMRQQQSAATTKPLSEDDERDLISRLTMMASQGQQSPGSDQQARPNSAHLNRVVQPAPLPMSETGWRAIEPPKGGSGSANKLPPAPTWAPNRSELTTRSSQPDGGEEARAGRPAQTETQTTKRPAASRAKRKKKTRKKTKGQAGGADASATTTTSRPNWLDKDDGESELLMAHSMAMGLRVLNEQLDNHHNH